MAFSAQRYRRSRRLYMTKNRRTFRKRNLTINLRRRRPARRASMQRIRKVKWGSRNIGGDRCYAKLRYVNAQTLTIAPASYATFQNQPLNLGSFLGPPTDTTSLAAVMGTTPNLSTLASLYLRYRIRGIKIKLTFWQQGGVPVVLYTNAQTSDSAFTVASQAPSPNFPNPTIAILPEQRWAKYKVCGATAAGARPTSLETYYSVNKVFGPDAIVKNDHAFTGEMQLAAPYWVPTVSSAASDESGPKYGPWMQYGIFTMSGDPAVDGAEPMGVLKIEQTVYTEFFGKRFSLA
nr:MAG: capsid protein [Rhinopithecus-associated circovirus 2]